jgi:hypothetical protein
MYTLGCVIVIGMITAFLHKMKWINVNNINNVNTSQFTKAELLKIFINSIQLITQNKWLVFAPILLLLFNAIIQLIFIILLTEQEITWRILEFEPRFYFFSQTHIFLKAMGNSFLGSINLMDSATYSTYNSSLLVIASSIILLITKKKIITRLEKITGSSLPLIKIIKTVSRITLSLIAIFLVITWLLHDSSHHRPAIYFLGVGVIVFLQTILVSSFIQSYIVTIIRLSFDNIDNKQNEILKLAAYRTPNLFYMNIVLLLISPSVPVSLLTLSQLTELTGDFFYFVNFLIPIHKYIFLAILLFTPLLLFTLTEKTSLISGVKNNLVIIKNIPIKYVTMLAVTLLIITIPSVIQLFIPGAHGRFSIVSFVLEFLFSSLYILLSLFMVVNFAFFYNGQACQNTVKCFK